jgi:hypothetical protein
MKITRIAAFMAVILLAVSFLPAVKAADKSDWPTLITVQNPVQVGNVVLNPGTYEFQLLPNSPDRNILRIYSLDRRQWDGFVFGFTAYRTRESGEFIFASKAGSNGEDALRYWFLPGYDRGIEFHSR